MTKNLFCKSKCGITILDKTQFNIKHILECGQIFRYKFDGKKYTVFSSDKMCEVYETPNTYEINTKNVDYFINFFDLNTDYNKIKQNIANLLNEKIINYGYGIRILKQDLLETMISFIISANNNIKRIQNSLFNLCEKIGEKKENFVCFPTLDTLKKTDENFWTEIKIGYRATQMIKTIQKLSKSDIMELENLETQQAKEKLLSFCGIGEKVADCILLFALGKKNVFPVDTWIEKVYHDFYGGILTDRHKISNELVCKFKNYSGYIQQYLFYYKRENEKHKGA